MAKKRRPPLTIASVMRGFGLEGKSSDYEKETYRESGTGIQQFVLKRKDTGRSVVRGSVFDIRKFLFGRRRI
jgi:hypothetical protein